MAATDELPGSSTMLPAVMRQTEDTGVSGQGVGEVAPEPRSIVNNPPPTLSAPTQVKQEGGGTSHFPIPPAPSPGSVGMQLTPGGVPSSHSNLPSPHPRPPTRPSISHQPTPNRTPMTELMRLFHQPPPGSPILRPPSIQPWKRPTPPPKLAPSIIAILQANAVLYKGFPPLLPPHTPLAPLSWTPREMPKPEKKKPKVPDFPRAVGGLLPPPFLPPGRVPGTLGLGEAGGQVLLNSISGLPAPWKIAPQPTYPQNKPLPTFSSSSFPRPPFGALTSPFPKTRDFPISPRAGGPPWQQAGPPPMLKSDTLAALQRAIAAAPRPVPGGSQGGPPFGQGLPTSLQKGLAGSPSLATNAYPSGPARPEGQMAYQPRVGTSGGQEAGRWGGGHPNPSRIVQPSPSHPEPNGDGGSEEERVDVEDGNVPIEDGNGGAKRDEDDTEDESE